MAAGGPPAACWPGSRWCWACARCRSARHRDRRSTAPSPRCTTRRKATMRSLELESTRGGGQLAAGRSLPMPSLPVETESRTLARHPAARAWMQSRRGRNAPLAIETLKRSRRTVVYRLWGSPPTGGSIIAKRCSDTAARLEIVLCEQVLPALPVSAPGLLGSLPDEDPRFTWIFLEDAGDRFYSPSESDHRNLLTRWMRSEEHT